MPRYIRVSVIEPTTCSMCDAASAPDMPVPICSTHAIKIYRHMQQIVDAVRDNHHNHMDVHVAIVQGVHDERYAKANSPVHRVYYARIGGLIKIGTTRDLRARFNNYPPDAELLAVERGGEDMESRRLRQFRHLLAERKEWFHPGVDLMDHIARLATKAA